MATELEWSHDFCLSCDRQISEGAYCSQACRLADLEKAGSAEPTTPGLHFSTSASSTASAGSGFYLPPAINFGAYRSTSKADSPPTSPGCDSSASHSYFPNSSSTSPPKRCLSPSSSRSSLSSMSSSSSQGLSAQAATELRGYMSSFDQTRDLKRRLSTMA